MKEEKLSTEFLRRLTRLEKAIKIYRETGNVGSLIPYLFRLASYCWCKSPVLKSKKSERNQ